MRFVPSFHPIVLVLIAPLLYQQTVVCAFGGVNSYQNGIQYVPSVQEQSNQAHRRRYHASVRSSVLFNSQNSNEVSSNDNNKKLDRSPPFEIKLDPTRPFRDFARDVKAAPFLENPLYQEIQIMYILLVIAAIYQNFVDNGSKHLLQSFQFPFLIAAFHLLCVSFSVELIGYKGYDREHMQSRMSALRALFSGPLEVYRVSKIDDIDTRDAREPLFVEFYSSIDDDVDSVERRRRQRLGKTPSNNKSAIDMDSSKYVLQTLKIEIAEGYEIKARKLLKRLNDDSRNGLRDKILYSSIRQDDNDRTKYTLTQRFKSIDQLRQYQNSFQFCLWSEKMREVLDSPMDVLVTTENVAS